MPRVEIKAMYEIIVSHTPEQGICALNHAIPASPPQCLTVTEEINIKFNLLGFVIPTERFKSIILTFLYNPTVPLSGTSKQCILLNQLSDAAKVQTKPSDDAMIIDEPAKPVAGSSKHPDDMDVIDSEKIY